MTKTELHNELTADTTAAASPRPLLAAPRRWWRALDRMTLETMNPPLPARPNRKVNPMTETTTSAATASDATISAATIRASAPGRTEHIDGARSQPDAEFARTIREGAPGRS